MTHLTTALSLLRVEPPVNELEVLTTMIDLAVTAAHGLPALRDRGEFLAAVPHPLPRFRESRVSHVSNADLRLPLTS